MRTSLLTLSFLCLQSYLLSAQITPLDSLRQAFSTAESDSAKFNHYFYIIDLVIAKGDSVHQEAALDSFRQMTEELKEPYYWGQYYYSEAKLLRRRGKPEAQRQTLLKAKSYYEQLDDERHLANTEYTIARTYLPEGDYESAFLGYERALKIFRRIGMEVMTANSLNALGVVQRRAGNLDSAVGYLKEAAALSRKLGDKEGEATALLNQAVIHKTNKEYELAIPLYERGLELAAGPPKDEGLAAYIHNNLSALYHDQQKYQLSLREGLKAYAFFSKHGQKRELAMISLGIATNLKSLERYAEALPKYKEALRLSEKELSAKRDVHQGLSECFAALQQPDSAYYHLTQASGLSQQLADETRLQALAEVEGRYQNQEKQAEIERLAAEDERKAKAISRRNWTLAISALALLIVLGLLGSVMKQRSQISHQKEVIQKALGEKELLLKEIHHRVKNNLQMISSLLNLQSRHLTDSAAVDALQLGKSRVRSMAMIHQQLYTNEEVDTLVNAKTYLEKLSKEILSTYQSSDQELQLSHDLTDIDLDIDILIPLGLLVNEAITNSVKYAFPNGQSGQLTISLQPSRDEQLLLSIEDNGIGTSSPSANGTGFGTMLMHTLAEQLGGELHRTENENGTLIQLEFPRHQLEATE